MRTGSDTGLLAVLGMAVLGALACGGREPPQGPREGGASTGVALEVSLTPEAQFKEGSVERIQDALRERGLLEGEVKRGDLDVPTSVALGRLQAERDLARTGQPDRATLEALGLEPQDVFQRRDIPKAQEQQRPAALREVPEQKEDKGR
jgi:hypothetical protein